MTSRTPKVTVAIPTYRREEVLIDTIHDVLLQSEKNLELIVVDQSTEHFPKTVAALTAIDDPRFRYFRTTPPAVTVARNFALDKAQSPYIVFLDDDVRLDKDLVKEFLKTFAEHPEISAIAGKVEQAGFKKLPILQFDEYTRSHGGYTGDAPGYTNGFPGGNCALRVEEAKAIGGFDTRYYGNAFREENDLSMRLFKRGYKIYYQPKAKLLHLAAPYGGNRVKTHIYDNFGFYKNELFFTLRFAEKKYIKRALKLKFYEYCILPEDASYKRRWYFRLGLVVAIWRVLFVKQRVAKEIK